jgi:hypothetical protein
MFFGRSLGQGVFSHRSLNPNSRCCQSIWVDCARCPVLSSTSVPPSQCDQSENYVVVEFVAELEGGEEFGDAAELEEEKDGVAGAG